MGRIEDMLAQLGAAFTVRDIMIPYENFILVNEEREVRKFFSEHDDYDYTGILIEGRLARYFSRGDPDPVAHPIRQEDLISDGTEILALVDLLVDREFFFVLSKNNVSGFVHFSDLNNEVAKLPFFLLLAAAESHVWSHVKEGLTEAHLQKALGQERFDEIEQERRSAEEERADLGGWEGLLYLPEIFKLANYRELVRTSNKQRSDLITIRNRVAHNDRLLVEKHKDVDKLRRVRNLCASLIEA